MKQGEKFTTDRAVHWGLGIGAALIAAALMWPGLFLKRAPNDSAGTIAEKWEFTTGGAITGALALGTDGTIYAASEDGFLYALDASGSVQWKFDAERMVVGPTIGADGTIYAINTEEHIFAINRAGDQLWTTRLAGEGTRSKRTRLIADAASKSRSLTPIKMRPGSR